MSNRANYAILMALGIIVVLVAIFAHQLGLGTPGFGSKKIAGVIIGVLIVLAGLYGYTRQPALAR